jgi:asparagine synthase (glutamine-hydrolysing)
MTAQLLVVHGPDASSVRAVFEEALRVHRRLFGAEPDDAALGAATGVAVFGSARGPAGTIARAADGRWVAGAGVIFPGHAAELLLGRSPGLDGTLACVEGMFALALGDPSARTLTLVTDRLGSLHLYRTAVLRTAVLSTSSMVLAALAAPRWDPVGCREFLGTGTVFEDRTLFEGIEKLGPGVVLEYRDGAPPRARTWWRLEDALHDGRPSTAGVPELAGALRGAVAVTCRRFPNAVFDLTGGYDSRAVLGAALRDGTAPQTVVVGDDGDRDVIASRRIASRFRLGHHQHRPRLGGAEWWGDARRAILFTDGEYDVLEYAPVLACHERLARRFDASVNGSNGEICRGFWWSLLVPHTGEVGRFDARRVAAGRFATQPAGAALLARRYDDDLVDHFAGVIRRATAGLERHPNTAHMDTVYLRLRMQRWQGRIASSTLRIWPAVSPFTFRAPIEAAVAIPASRRAWNRAAVRLIEHLDPRLAELPLAQGYPAQPLRVGNVHRYWPLMVELGTKLRRRLPGARPPNVAVNRARPLWADDGFRELLDPGRMLTAGLYDEGRLRAFLARSQQGAFGGVQQLGRVATLELLARTVAGARPPRAPA